MTCQPLPEYLHDFEGSLYDMRKSKETRYSVPLRSVYSRHYRTIENTVELKASIRAGEYTWPGGYQLMFYTSDGAALCFDCVKKNLISILDSIKTKANDGWRVVGMINLSEQDESETCADCSKSFGEYEAR